MMATKKKGLGRGLNALLGGTETVAVMTTVQHEDELRELAIAETDPELKEKLWEEYKKYKAGL